MGSINDYESVENEVVNDGGVNYESNISIENSKRCNLSQASAEGIVEANSNRPTLEINDGISNESIVLKNIGKTITKCGRRVKVPKLFNY